MACTKDLTSLNDDLKNPEVVPPATLFANAERELFDSHASANVFVNVHRIIAQYWQQTTYNDESRYDLDGNSLPGAWWRDHYFYVNKNLRECKTAVLASEVTDVVRKNQLALLEILEVMSYYYLVNTFGDIPYSEALKNDNSFPKYDDANTIYIDLLARLSKAITDLDATGGSFSSSDIVYRGVVPRWKKMAASLKLKMAMLIADSDGPVHELRARKRLPLACSLLMQITSCCNTSALLRMPTRFGTSCGTAAVRISWPAPRW